MNRDALRYLLDARISVIRRHLSDGLYALAAFRAIWQWRDAVELAEIEGRAR